MEENFKVYCHENKINGKKYFGITKQEPERRWKYGKAYSENKYFTNAINKYGWNNFHHIIIFDNLSKEVACQIEIYLISKYNTTNTNNGYNQASGGEHPTPTKEIIQKMSIPIVQMDSFGSVKKYWESACEIYKKTNLDSSAISSCCKGKNISVKKEYFMYQCDYEEYIKDGKDISDKKELRRFKIEREELRKINYKKKKEIKDKNKEIYPTCISIVQLDMCGNFIKEYSGIRSAERELKHSGITNSCKGLSKSCNGFMFMYKEEYDKINKKEFEKRIAFANEDNTIRKIVQLSKYENFIKVWEKQSDASSFYNISQTPISMCCRGIAKTAHGFKWMYYNDYIEKRGEII